MKRAVWVLVALCGTGCGRDASGLPAEGDPDGDPGNARRGPQDALQGPGGAPGGQDAGSGPGGAGGGAGPDARAPDAVACNVLNPMTGQTCPTGTRCAFPGDRCQPSSDLGACVAAKGAACEGERCGPYQDCRTGLVCSPSLGNLCGKLCRTKADCGGRECYTGTGFSPFQGCPAIGYCAQPVGVALRCP